MNAHVYVCSCLLQILHKMRHIIKTSFNPSFSCLVNTQSQFISLTSPSPTVMLTLPLVSPYFSLSSDHLNFPTLPLIQKSLGSPSSRPFYVTPWSCTLVGDCSWYLHCDWVCGVQCGCPGGLLRGGQEAYTTQNQVGFDEVKLGIGLLDSM